MDSPIHWPAKILLLDQAGEHVCWIVREHAIELWREGKIRLHLQRRFVRAVQAWPADLAKYFPRPGSIRGRAYSHDHEAADNPEGCWTLIRIPNRDHGVFLRVVADCGGLRRIRPSDCLAA